jgi:hypothetical protein
MAGIRIFIYHRKMRVFERCFIMEKDLSTTKKLNLVQEKFKLFSKDQPK